MNQYIATLSGTLIASIFDSVDHHPCVMETVDTWLRHGLSVQLRRDKPVTVIAPIKPANPTPKKARKTLHKLIARPDWNTGDTVYLCWSRLPVDPRLHLSQYRHVKGNVENFRSGAGVTKTVGVRFGDDPELIWLRPTELVSTPEVDL